jgi:hypothetical protein
VVGGFEALFPEDIDPDKSVVGGLNEFVFFFGLRARWPVDSLVYDAKGSRWEDVIDA